MIETAPHDSEKQNEDPLKTPTPEAGEIPDHVPPEWVDTYLEKPSWTQSVKERLSKVAMRLTYPARHKKGSGRHRSGHNLWIFQHRDRSSNKESLQPMDESIRPSTAEVAHTINAQGLKQTAEPSAELGKEVKSRTIQADASNENQQEQRDAIDKAA